MGVRGTPWDDEQGNRWLPAFWETLKLSLAQPTDFFTLVKSGTNVLRPWIYGTIVSSIAFFVAAAFQTLLGQAAFGGKLFHGMGRALLPALAFSLPVSTAVMAVVAIFVVPFGTAFGFVLQAALYHLCLMILGSAKGTFADTFRVVCYASGPHLFQVVPLLGGMLGVIWTFVLCIIGLKTVHETSSGKAVLAAFLPMMFCCALVLLSLSLVAGGIVGAFLQGN